MLFLNEYDSHCTFEFITYCDEKKIILFCLPPYTTYFFQLLNMVVFQPYKHWHAKALDEATQTGCYNFNKVKFLHFLPQF